MSATANGREKAGEVGHRRHRSNSDPQATAIALAHLRNEEANKKGHHHHHHHGSGGTMRTGSLGSNSRTPAPVEGPTVHKPHSRLGALSRFFKPWRWKRKKKSDKFEQTSRTLERKISMRATKEDLIKKGVLLPEALDKTALHKDSSNHHHHHHHHPAQVNGVVVTDSSESRGYPGEPLMIPDISILSLPGEDSQLPEPPIPVSEIGPIPPPPMFCTPSPQFLQDLRERLPPVVPPHPSTPDTSLVEEVPAKEPMLSAMPKKSALKKRSTTSSSLPYPLVMPLSAQNRPSGSSYFTPENKENLLPTLDPADLENMILWRDYYGEDETCRQVAKIARKDSLALKLSQRPDAKELIEKNILHVQSERERQETREFIGNKLIRRLSLRPTAEELEQRNILKNQTPEELRKEKEQKKKMLLRKLSFRPTIEELKERKIITFNDYVEVTQAQEYDRRADKPWTRLTPKDKAAIRKELNEFKSLEMAVHEDSRHLTRFHRP